MTPADSPPSAPPASNAATDPVALATENVQLRAENATLRERIAELERRLGLNSSNSGKPPSSDGLKKPARTTSFARAVGT